MKPKRAFVGCGALVEGGYVATCRHVWLKATAENSEKVPAVEIEYPHRREGDAAVSSPAGLADACEEAPGQGPDLVLLLPDDIPSGVMTLQLASHERFESGPGYAIAGLVGRNRRRPKEPQDVRIDGTVADYKNADGLRQFTGTADTGYWSERGSSGSPVFLDRGQQMAGMLRLSELGANQGQSHLHEAFVLPGTTIRSHLVRLVAAPVAEAQKIDLDKLKPVLAALGEQDVPVGEVPGRLLEFVEAAKAHAETPLSPSNEGADIEATIGTSRDKLRALDTAGARELLQTKIDEENEARAQRLLPLLRERAAVERLALDYEAARSTHGEIAKLAPDDVWNWIGLGDLWRTTGPLDRAADAFRSAEAAARRVADEREVAVVKNRIGDVLLSKGDRAGALTTYRAALKIIEPLAASDPANTEWQRDLFVSQIKIGDVLEVEGDRRTALSAYRAGLEIAETLSGSDSDNAEWQRDLSVCHERIGNVLRAEGDRMGALAAYRAGLDIRKALAARDPGNAGWQRDLLISHGKIGNVLIDEGDREKAFAACHASLDIARALAARDPANAEWQRDLSVSHDRMGDALMAEGQHEASLEAYRAGLDIAETLAARDPANMRWQRDLSVSQNKIGDALQVIGDRPGALAAYRAGLDISETLAARDPGNAEWQRDLSVSHDRLGDVLRAEDDHEAALEAYRTGFRIREALVARDSANAEWQRDLSISHNKIGDMLRTEGDVAGALAAYRAGLDIRQSLAVRDPTNTQWQHDVSLNQTRIGDMLLLDGDHQGALAAYDTGLKISGALAAGDPTNAEWQRELSVSQNKLGDVLLAMNDQRGALAAYGAGLEIAQSLAARDPGNAEWQRDLIVSCVKMSEVEPAKARDYLSKALGITRSLDADGRLPPADAWMLDALAKSLAALAED